VSGDVGYVAFFSFATNLPAGNNNNASVNLDTAPDLELLAKIQASDDFHSAQVIEL
jgi:hypothetical protein